MKIKFTIDCEYEINTIGDAQAVLDSYERALDTLREYGAAESDFENVKLLDQQVTQKNNAKKAGGHARAKKLDKSRRSEIARNAANKRWGNV